MGKTKYFIYLSDDEKKQLQTIIDTAPEKTALRAKILLESDFKNPDYCSNTKLAQKLNTSHVTVHRVRSEYAQHGLEYAIIPKGTHPIERSPVRTDEDRKKILEVIYSDPPFGYKWWTIRLIAKTCVDRGIFDYLAPSAVHKIIKEENIDLRRPDRFSK